jgi:hypothetical protein
MMDVIVLFCYCSIESCSVRIQLDSVMSVFN